MLVDTIGDRWYLAKSQKSTIINHPAVVYRWIERTAFESEYDSGAAKVEAYSETYIQS
jgi:hypothetical protein